MPEALLPEQIVASVRLLRLSGRDEIRVRLEPPELGTVRLRVVAVDGELTVRMQAQRVATAEALQQALPQLREALQQAQFSTSTLEVMTGDGWSFQAESGQGEAEGAESESLGIVPGDDGEAEPREGEVTAVGAGDASGQLVDYRA